MDRNRQTPRADRSLSTHTCPRRGRAYSPSLRRPLIANATIPARHPSTARPAVSRKTPLGHRPDPVRPLPPRKAIRSRHPRLDTDAARLPTPRLDTKRLSPPRIPRSTATRPLRLNLPSLAHGLPMERDHAYDSETFRERPRLRRSRDEIGEILRRSARSYGDIPEIMLGFSGLRNLCAYHRPSVKIPHTFLIWEKTPATLYFLFVHSFFGPEPSRAVPSRPARAVPSRPEQFTPLPRQVLHGLCSSRGHLLLGPRGAVCGSKGPCRRVGW